MMNRALTCALIMWLHAGMCRAEVIRLSTGETLRVTIIERSASVIRCVHPVLGEFSVAADQATIVSETSATTTTSTASTGEQAGSSSGAAQAPAASAPETPGDPPVAPPTTQPEAKKRAWKYRLVLAAADASGNSDTASASVLLTAQRETAQLRTVADVSYFFARSDGATSENRLSTGGRHDWLNPDKPHFWFADARFDYDEFQSWRYRATGHVGVGYHLFTPPKLKLDALAGLGAVKQWLSDDDDLRPEALLGLDGVYTLAPRHSIRFASTFYPDVIDINIWRWVNSAAWAWTVDERTNLALTAGFQQEYQSQVDPGDAHNDLRIYAGLQLDF